MLLMIELAREADGRWIADVADLSGVTVYGSSQSEAVRKAEALALLVLSERLEHGEDLRTGHPRQEPEAFDRLEFRPVELAF